MENIRLPTQQRPTQHEGDNDQEIEIEQAEPTVQAQYRELILEPPQPALRMIVEPPIDYDGEKFSEFIFDWDAMTGHDFLRAEREFVHRYKPDKSESFVLPESKHLYHEILAAHHANVPVAVIQKLPRRYYVPLRTEALKACGSSPEEKEKE